MPPLDACPLCRTVLAEAAVQCAGCGADLRPYLDIDALADRYLKLARELLSRGQTERAAHLIEQLPRVASIEARELAELQARLAIQRGDFPAAERALAACGADEAAYVRGELEQRRANLAKARELYNHGLSAARAGDFQLATRYLQDAAALDPADPNIWAVKLKADLKCRYFQRCYADLQRLDQLAARPPEFHNLEELLPAVVLQRAKPE